MDRASEARTRASQVLREEELPQVPKPAHQRQPPVGTSPSALEMANNNSQDGIAKPRSSKSGGGGKPRKKVLIVGAGAAGMSAAYHLSEHPDDFEVTLIDAVNYCGGQAFSIPIDKERHGASWVNQGVQGGSYIFHHTCTMFARQGYHADPCKLHVSFGKDDLFWTNVFPTKILEKHRKQVARLSKVLKITRILEIFFALIPLQLVLRLFWFSTEFITSIALPMTALFLGTGNETPRVPFMMLERLCTSPTYGMWYPSDEKTVVSNKPPMIVFPKFSDFYGSWERDLKRRGVHVRLSTELTEVVKRDKKMGVLVKIKNRTPAPDNHNPNGGDPDAPEFEEHYDELILCTLADTSKRLLAKTSTWRERRVLGNAKFSNDITITHSDAEYMKKHYENFYRDDLAVKNINGRDDTYRVEAAKKEFRPMYYIKTYPEDRTKLEMCFDCTNYQSQFPEKVPFENHVFQTIFLNKERDGHLWSDDEIDESKIIRKDWWHQLCHSWTHYIFVVPWMMFLQAKNHTRFASSWTMVNAHEVAIISGLAAAVDLGAKYPEDLEHDWFAFLCFRLYYFLAYGKIYRRWFSSHRYRLRNGEGEAGKRGRFLGWGWNRGTYRGPGVTEEERSSWKKEMELGNSKGNWGENTWEEEEEEVDDEVETPTVVSPGEASEQVSPAEDAKPGRPKAKRRSETQEAVSHIIKKMAKEM